MTATISALTVNWQYFTYNKQNPNLDKKTGLPEPGFKKCFFSTIFFFQ
jgi:hypothetical protein